MANKRPLRVLMVVHQFLPRHQAGSEIYTYQLAQSLRARGHDVTLFFTEFRPDRPQYELSRGEYDGIPYVEAVHNHQFASFRHTYSDPLMEDNFRQVLDRCEPDVVHLQHLHLHSMGYIGIARDRGLPVVYTLHEYMLMCLNLGLLLKPDASLCHGPDAEACARCAAERYPHLAPEPLGSPMAPARSILQKMAPGIWQSVQRMGWLGGNGKSHAALVDATRLRLDEVKAQLDRVDLFIAPSRFLLERFLEHRFMPSDRIVYSDYGVVSDPAPQVKARRPPPIRVGYVGTIAEFKGVHLILEAFRSIGDAGIECDIYGDVDVFPDFKRRVLNSGIPPAVRLRGRLERENVPHALAELDALIVPSIWYENSPLTIHEAFTAGIPVITSDRGGMAELVEHGKTGLHFKLGDAADLRRQLLRIVQEPGLLEALGRRFPALKSMETDAEDMEQRYRGLLAAKLAS